MQKAIVAAKKAVAIGQQQSVANFPEYPTALLCVRILLCMVTGTVAALLGLQGFPGFFLCTLAVPLSNAWFARIVPVQESTYDDTQLTLATQLPPAVAAHLLCWILISSSSGQAANRA